MIYGHFCPRRCVGWSISAIFTQCSSTVKYPAMSKAVGVINEACQNANEQLEKRKAADEAGSKKKAKSELVGPDDGSDDVVVKPKVKVFVTEPVVKDDSGSDEPAPKEKAIAAKSKLKLMLAIRQLPVPWRRGKLEEVDYMIYDSSPLGKIMDNYCGRLGLQLGDILFSHRGRLIVTKNTAEGFGIADGDIIWVNWA